MDAPTIGSIFSKHLAFPAGGKARLSIDAFAERLTEARLGQVHGFRDVSEWVDHFFQIEHDGEALEREFRIVATLGEGEDAPVLEMELGEQEFAIVETEDEIVAMSDAGSIVLGRTSDLSARLQAAQLPASERVSMNAAFRGPGERAYYVTRGGQILTLDAKSVAKVLAAAPARAEPLVHLTKAPERLAAFRPTVRSDVPARPSEPLRKLADLAKGAARGGGPQVIVIEKSGEIREQAGADARWWHRLTSTLAGRREGSSSVLAGASAVAIGRQTFAVKAGGVTAIVQRPSEGLTRRNNAEARRSELAADATRAPAWLRRVIDERPRPAQPFWIDPSRTSATRTSPAGGRPGWVDAAMSQAREVRRRAGEEIARQAQSASATALVAARERGPDTVASRTSDGRSAGPAARARLHAAADVRFAERGLQMSVLGHGALPASLLRNVFLGLERSLALESGASLTAPSRAGRASAAAAETPSNTTGSGIDIEIVTRRISSATAEVALHSPFDGTSVRVGPEFIPVLTSVSSYAPVEIATPRPVPAVPLEDPFAAIESTPLAAIYPRGVRSQLPRGEATVVRGAAGADVVTSVLTFGLDPPAASPTSAPSVGTQAPIGRHVLEIPELGDVVAPRPTVPDAPASMTASGWLDWAVQNSRHARAKAAGETVERRSMDLGLSRVLGQPSSIRTAVGPEERAYYPSEEAARERLDRTPSMFIRFDAQPGGAGPRVRSEMSHQGPEIGLFAVPSTVDGSFATANPWRFPAGDSSLPRPRVAQPNGESAPFIEGRWTPAGGARTPIPVRLSPMFLQDVNARRAPDPVASAPRYSAEAEPLSEEYVVPVPLWVQMTPDSPWLPPEHAAPRGTASVNGMLVPQVRGSAVNAGGVAAAGAVGGPSLGTEGITLARPGAEGFSLGNGRALGSSGERSGLGVAGRTASILGSSPGVGSLGAAGPEMSIAAPAMAAGSPASSLAQTAPSDGGLAHGFSKRGADDPTARGYFPSERRAAEAAKRPASPARPLPGEARSTETRGYFPSEQRAAEAAEKVRQAGPRTASAARVREPDTVSYYPSEVRRASRQGWGGTLRFRFPSAARWWPTEARPASSASRDVAAARGAAATEYVRVTAAPASSDSSLGMVGFGAAGAGAAVLGGAALAGSPAAASGSVRAATGSAMSAPAALARGRRGEGTSYFPSELAAAEAAEKAGRDAPSGAIAGAPGESEVAYVAVSSTGEARVVNASHAAAIRGRDRGTSVDMTVVAAMAPQAPSMEEMALAGHERPHAKAKKEGAAKSAAGRSDNLSLQGTVDSLAQRIYHRLKRRLASDRERFGG